MTLRWPQVNDDVSRQQATCHRSWQHLLSASTSSRTSGWSSIWLHQHPHTHGASFTKQVSYRRLAPRVLCFALCKLLLGILGSCVVEFWFDRVVVRWIAPIPRVLEHSTEHNSLFSAFVNRQHSHNFVAATPAAPAAPAASFAAAGPVCVRVVAMFDSSVELRLRYRSLISDYSVDSFCSFPFVRRWRLTFVHSLPAWFVHCRCLWSLQSFASKMWKLNW